MRNKKYNSYHSFIKTSLQENILPDELSKQIPKSTRSRFKYDDHSTLFGYEWAQNITAEQETIKSFIQDKNAIKIYKAINLVKSIIIKLFLKVPKKLIIDIKKKVIHAVDKFKDVIGFEKILKLFSITKYRYHSWKNQLTHRCLDSPLAKCYKIITNQLTVRETDKIKELCTDTQFKGWPIYAIAKYALLNDILSVSTNTWNKYVNILQLQKVLPDSRRKKHRIGIRVDRIHALWHVDVTIFRTMDNVKTYIYLIVDNFSRFILSFKVSLNIKAAICFDNVKAAYEKYLKPREDENTIVTNVMTDGGSENNGLEKVSDFIKKIVAQTDIEFSNSMIEAVNKTLKYRHLFQESIQDFDMLEKKLEKFVYDYNNRPHGALNGLTPQQVLNGQTIDLEKVKRQIESSRIKRIEDNRKYSCGLC